MENTHEKWVRIMQEHKAWWTYSGDPKLPHAILTSGRHSNCYVNCPIIFEYQTLLNDVARDLLQESFNGSQDIAQPSCVVGPATGGAQLAEAVATKLNVPYFPVFVQKDNTLPHVEVDGDIMYKEQVLLVDDVISTFSTINIVHSHLSNFCGVQWHPYIFSFINGSGRALHGKQIVFSLVSYAMQTWKNEKECQLCAAGSPALRRPKYNWSKFIP